MKNNAACHESDAGLTLNGPQVKQRLHKVLGHVFIMHTPVLGDCIHYFTFVKVCCNFRITGVVKSVNVFLCIFKE